MEVTVSQVMKYIDYEYSELIKCKYWNSKGRELVYQSLSGLEELNMKLYSMILLKTYYEYMRLFDNLGLCGCPICKGKVEVDRFKDKLSADEWIISGMCQKCQDMTFGY